MRPTLKRLDDQHRAALNGGSIGFDMVLEFEDLVPAPDLLVHFAHWITPVNQPKRYDTHFFLAEAPASTWRCTTATKRLSWSGSRRNGRSPTPRPAASSWSSPPRKTWRS